METNSSKVTRAKLDVDQRLADELRRCGVYSTLAGLSRALGQNPTYYVCMRKRGYGLHIGSLTFFQARLNRSLDDEPDVRERARLRSAIAAIETAVQEKCMLRELELQSSCQ